MSRPVRLSARLRFLLSLALPGEPLWDLCCDHGLLGMRALQEGLVTEVHFVDQVPSIIATLRERLKAESLVSGRAFIHLSGAEKLTHELRGTVVIAGVGGDRIQEILRALHRNGLLQSNRLVLSPHKDESVFAAGLEKFLNVDWQIRTPQDVAESGRLRPIWTLERRVPQAEI